MIINKENIDFYQNTFQQIKHLENISQFEHTSAITKGKFPNEIYSNAYKLSLISNFLRLFIEQ